MIGAVIVDDDVETLQGLARLIPWEANGFRVVGTATDGRSALSLVRKHRPGLLIADITMPGMDGLSLIRASQSVCPNLKSIVLTCHEDFNFAREAISLGVMDYLLKITLTPESLVRSLQRIQQAVGRTQGTDEALLALRRQLDDSRVRVQSDFFVSLIEGGEQKADELLAKAAHLGIGFPGIAFRAFAFFIDHGTGSPAGGETRSAALRSARQTVVGAFGSTRSTNEFTIEGRCFVVLRWYRSEPFTLSTELVSRLQSAMRRVRTRQGLEVSCCVSQPHQAVRELPKAVSECCDLREGYFYAGSGRVLWDRPQWAGSPRPAAYGQYSARLVHVLHSPTDASIRRFTNHLAELGAEATALPAEVRELLHRLLVDVDAAANRRGFVLRHDMATAYTFPACLRLFAGVLKSYQECSREALSISSREEIVTVLSYVDAHPGQRIKCETMAALVNLSCAYFSRLFKREVGMPFTDYLLRTRIQHALNLLVHTRLSFEQITWEVGLENASYFHRAFKKITGMTPREARNGRRPTPVLARNRASRVGRGHERP